MCTSKQFIPSPSEMKHVQTMNTVLMSPDRTKHMSTIVKIKKDYTKFEFYLDYEHIQNMNMLHVHIICTGGEIFSQSC